MMTRWEGRCVGFLLCRAAECFEAHHVAHLSCGLIVIVTLRVRLAESIGCQEEAATPQLCCELHTEVPVLQNLWRALVVGHERRRPADEWQIAVSSRNMRRECLMAQFSALRHFLILQLASCSAHRHGLQCQ